MKTLKNTQQILAFALVAGSIVNVQAARLGGGGTEHTGNLGSIDYPNTDRTNFNASGSNRSAIQNAIDDAAADGGGTANLSSQTYEVNDPVVPKKKVRLRGASTSGTVIKRDFTPVSSDGLILHDTRRGGQSGSLNDTEIQSLTLDGNYRTRDLENNDTMHGIYYNSSNTSDYHYRTLYSKLKIQRFNVAILLGGMRHVTLLNSNLDQCGASNLAHQWYSRRTGNARLKGTTIQRSLKGSGVKATGGTSSFSWESRTLIVENCNIKDNYRSNLNTNAYGYMRVNDCRMTGSKTLAGIWLGYQGPNNSSRNIQFNSDIINNVVEDNDGDGIFGEYCNKIWIEGNRSRDNGDDNYSTLSVTNWESDNNTR